MHRKILLWGIGFAITAVLLGAFGAHALKSFLTPEKKEHQNNPYNNSDPAANNKEI